VLYLNTKPLYSNSRFGVVPQLKCCTSTQGMLYFNTRNVVPELKMCCTSTQGMLYLETRRKPENS
jgi:hypothetical protein